MSKSKVGGLNHRARRKLARANLRDLWTPKFIRKLLRKKHQTIW